LNTSATVSVSELPKGTDNSWADTTGTNSGNPSMSSAPPQTTNDDMPCLRPWKLYLSSKRQFHSKQALQQGWTTTRVRTSVFETIQGLGSNLTYTPCDGYPRVFFTPMPNSFSKMLVSVTKTFWEPLASEKNGGNGGKGDTLFNSSQPSCQLTEQVCGHLWDYYYLLGLDAGAENGRRNRYRAEDFLPPLCLALGPKVGNNRITECEISIGKKVAYIIWPIDIANLPCAFTGNGSVDDVMNLKAGQKLNHTNIISTRDALTLDGINLYLRSVISDGTTSVFTESYVSKSVINGPFTFTYPNVYLLAEGIYVRGTVYNRQEKTKSLWSSKIGSAPLITLRAEDVATPVPIRPDSEEVNNLEYERLVARGEYNPIFPESISKVYRPFNTRHLKGDLPASVYYDARFSDCWGKQGHCGTIRQGDYFPEISLSLKLWKSLIGSAIDLPESCKFVQTVNPVDPPIILDHDEQSALPVPEITFHTQKSYTTPASLQINLPSSGQRGGSGAVSRAGSSAQPLPFLAVPTPLATKIPTLDEIMPSNGGRTVPKYSIWTEMAQWSRISHLGRILNDAFAGNSAVTGLNVSSTDDMRVGEGASGEDSRHGSMGNLNYYVSSSNGQYEHVSLGAGLLPLVILMFFIFLS
jgi:hypothetical protein